MLGRILILMSALLFVGITVNAQVDQNGAVLKGAWRMTITPEAGGPPPFPVLIAFTSDGGVFQADQGPAAPGQPVSIFTPGLGEWQRSARRRFLVTYTQLQYNQANELIGSVRARLTADLNAAANLLTGNGTFEFFDVDDTLLFSGEGTVEAGKLPVLGANQPLP